MLKRCTRFLGLALAGCLMVAGARGQSYTIHFMKGTARIDQLNSRTADCLDALKYRLDDCRNQEGTLTLTALQSVVDRYDPDARALALEQAVALQEFLTKNYLNGQSFAFDIKVDAQTDLDNRVIVELSRTKKAAVREAYAAPVVREDDVQDVAPMVQKEQAAPDTRVADTHTVNTTQPVEKPKVKTKAPAHFLLGSVGIGIKTNGLLFAGLLPDCSFYTPVPNAAVEAYMLGRYSVQVSFAYALPYNKGDKTNLFSLTGFTLEPRFWLWNDSRYRGLYAGIYGQYGTFDVRIKEKLSDNCTGSFFGGGLSVGWLQPVWKGFFAEAGVQVGYRSDATDVYTYTAGSPYKRLASVTLNSFTLQGFNVSIGYRF